VSTWPAARTGRSANTMELGAMPLSVSFPPSRAAPRALRTISEGIISFSAALGTPIVFTGAAPGRVAAGEADAAGVAVGAGAGFAAPWAKASAGAQSRAAMIMQVRAFIVMGFKPSVLGLTLLCTLRHGQGPVVARPPPDAERKITRLAMQIRQKLHGR